MAGQSLATTTPLVGSFPTGVHKRVINEGWRETKRDFVVIIFFPIFIALIVVVAVFLLVRFCVRLQWIDLK